MHEASTARALLTAFVLIYGTATVLIDSNRTHASNPMWAGHARFHVVWQTSSTALLSLMEVWLVWSKPDDSSRFYLAAALVAVSLAGFLLAQATRRVYGGTLYDPNGILPLRVRLGGKVLEIDGNAAAVCCAIPVVAFIVALFHHAIQNGRA